ncbi:alpha/beta fold hydrolase [Micromonospora haikouensis]|uniref:alpha/beta fold hydrolase n=1 Tax=Micromonospora haikouensis TaxID=686309 RepID=UPI003D8D4C14
MWRGLLPELADSYHVIAPDLRGFGDSDAPPGGYDKKTVAADLHGLLTGLGLAGDFRLVGHDVGTMVAYAYAAAHPDEVPRLVLTEAPILDEGRLVEDSDHWLLKEHPQRPSRPPVTRCPSCTTDTPPRPGSARLGSVIKRKASKLIYAMTQTS